jgi:tetratricopeptide (TPR) repeat protein
LVIGFKKWNKFLLFVPSSKKKANYANMKILRYSLSVLLLVAISATAYGQSTKADAIKLFNKALEEAKANNLDQAIAEFTEAITLAEELGEEGADIKERSEKQLPGLYYKRAVEVFNTFRSSKQLSDLDEAIEEFNEAAQVSDQYDNEELEQKAMGIIPQLHYQKSIFLFKANDLAGAEDELTKAIDYNDNYAKAYFQRSVVYKKLNPTDLDGYIALVDEAIDVAEDTGDNRTLRSAKESAHDELLYRAVKQTENNRLSTAIEMLNQALKYDPESEDVYYRLAEALNKQGKYDDALTHANKALELENGGKSEKAKIYFEIGFAQQGKGNNSAACSAFQNAAFGAFKAPAEHKMEYELKCETAR